MAESVAGAHLQVDDVVTVRVSVKGTVSSDGLRVFLNYNGLAVTVLARAATAVKA